MRFERCSVNYVDRPLEETGDILFKADVFVDRPFGPGLELDHYVEVAVWPVIATRKRPEYSGMRHAMRAQGVLVATKNSTDSMSRLRGLQTLAADLQHFPDEHGYIYACQLGECGLLA